MNEEIKINWNDEEADGQRDRSTERQRRTTIEEEREAVGQEKQLETEAR